MMKRRLVRITLLPLFFLLVSCSNDIELFSPDQKKAYVVFGVLNSTDPLQQVKVRMASVTNGAISDISLDSTEFSANPRLQVSIQEWHNTNYATFPMEPVRYSKEPGIFLNTRNDLFETRFIPFMDMDYKLIITNPDNGDQVTSKVQPVPAPKLGAPTWAWIRYNFSDTVNPFNIRFKEVPRTYVYLVRFTIHYVEVYAGGDTMVRQESWVFRPRYVDSPPEYGSTRENYGNEHNRYMTKAYTYNVFDQLIPDRENVFYRQLICFEVSVWGGDRNLRFYTELGQKFNDNRKLIFTNINNGIGFFGACAFAGCTGILPDQTFMEGLLVNTRTARLKFRTELYHTGNTPISPKTDPFFSTIREGCDEK